MTSPHLHNLFAAEQNTFHFLPIFFYFIILSLVLVSVWFVFVLFFPFCFHPCHTHVAHWKRLIHSNAFSISIEFHRISQEELARTRMCRTLKCSIKIDYIVHPSNRSYPIQLRIHHFWHTTILDTLLNLPHTLNYAFHYINIPDRYIIFTHREHTRTHSILACTWASSTQFSKISHACPRSSIFRIARILTHRTIESDITNRIIPAHRLALAERHRLSPICDLP